MIKIEFELDQDLYGEHTEEIIRAILIAGFHGYKTFSPDTIKVTDDPLGNEGIIVLNGSEIQSNHSRVKFAEGLIIQMPVDHEGRNTWLLNYGTSNEAGMLRQMHENGIDKRLNWNNTTQSLDPVV